MKIYTKKGDAGETQLFLGKTLSKASLNIHVLGSIDSCNASLGLALTSLNPSYTKRKKEILDIQSTLFSLGASLAGAPGQKDFNKATEALEEWIDAMDKELPPLKNFILPGGEVSAAQLHCTRALCRQAERQLVALFESTEKSEEALLPYINRLSDYLFVCARWLNVSSGRAESIWS